MNSKENKMNSNTNSKKTKKTCTCSTCGKTGHNASNKKFHPDYEFTGVSVPAPKKICEWCEHWIEDWLLPGAEPERDTKWHYESDMIKMMSEYNGSIQLACGMCADNMEECQPGFIRQGDWLKEFGTEDPIAASAAAKAMWAKWEEESAAAKAKCDPYMEELIECVKCEKEVKRMDLKWNEGGGSYTDVCKKCASGDNQDDDDSKDLIIIKGAKPEPIPIVVISENRKWIPIGVISENRKCLTPCKTRPMMGMSWWKCLGYDSPCSCAHEAQAKCK